MVKRVDMLTDALNAYDARDRSELERVLRKHLAMIDSLFFAISSGSREHKVWLKTSIDAHFAGRPVLPVPTAARSRTDDGNC